MKGLATLRKSKGLTQVKLAEILGIDVITVSRWERGVQDPSLKMLSVLTEYFGCTADTILNPPAAVSGALPHSKEPCLKRRLNQAKKRLVA